MAKRTQLESAMSAIREEANVLVLRKHPKPRDILESFSDGVLYLDVQDKVGEWHRYRFRPEEDLVALEIAESSTERKHVKQGELT